LNQIPGIVAVSLDISQRWSFGQSYMKSSAVRFEILNRSSWSLNCSEDSEFGTIKSASLDRLLKCNVEFCGRARICIQHATLIHIYELYLGILVQLDWSCLSFLQMFSEWSSGNENPFFDGFRSMKLMFWWSMVHSQSECIRTYL
jgi:hypothetical protein